VEDVCDLLSVQQLRIACRRCSIRLRSLPVGVQDLVLQGYDRAVSLIYFRLTLTRQVSSFHKRTDGVASPSARNPSLYFADQLKTHSISDHSMPCLAGLCSGGGARPTTVR